MGESNELFAAVNMIKHDVDTIKKIQVLILSSNNTQKMNFVSKLRADTLLFRVYKEIDGNKTQKDIAGTIDTLEMNVTNKIKKLLELCLIETKDFSKGKHIYKHTIAEQAFKLIKAVESGKWQN